MNSETINYKNEKETQEYLEYIFHTLIDSLRKIVKTDDKLVKSIDERYEKALIGFLNYVPTNYLKEIFVVFESIMILFSCIDIDKLIKNKDKIKLPFNKTQIIEGKKNINKVKSFFITLIEDKFNSPREKEFLKSLIGKLDPIFNSVAYICENLPICIENCIVFKSVNDIF